MGKKSYQMLEILSFSDRERTLPPSTEISVLTFVAKKSTMKLSLRGVLFLENRQENVKLNVVLLLVLETKALLFCIDNYQPNIIIKQYV